jgi:hypothetical protein
MSASVSLVKLPTGSIRYSACSMGSVNQVCFRYRSCQHKLIHFYSFSIASDTVQHLRTEINIVFWSYSHLYKIRFGPNRVKPTHLIRCEQSNSRAVSMLTLHILSSCQCGYVPTSKLQTVILKKIAAIFSAWRQDVKAGGEGVCSIFHTCWAPRKPLASSLRCRKMMQCQGTWLVRQNLGES